MKTHKARKINVASQIQYCVDMYQFILQTTYQVSNTNFKLYWDKMWRHKMVMFDPTLIATQ